MQIGMKNTYIKLEQLPNISWPLDEEYRNETHVWNEVKNSIRKQGRGPHRYHESVRIFIGNSGQLRVSADKGNNYCTTQRAQRDECHHEKAIAIGCMKEIGKRKEREKVARKVNDIL